MHSNQGAGFQPQQKGGDVLLLKNKMNKTPQDLKWLICLKLWYYLQPKAMLLQALLQKTTSNIEKKTVEQSLRHICTSNIESDFIGTCTAHKLHATRHTEALWLYLKGLNVLTGICQIKLVWT